MSVSLKRIYEPASRSDGARVLVDRLWLAVSASSAHGWTGGCAILLLHLSCVSGSMPILDYEVISDGGISKS